MTLIELLVVIVILTTLVAAAIPLLSPANDDRRIREASRQVNTFITGAQARAISLRRPVGVALNRLSRSTQKAEDNGVCLELFYVEELPPYAGFDANSRACVAIHPDLKFHPGMVLIRFGVPVSGRPPQWVPDLFPTGTIRPGDVVEINGTQFRLLPNNDSSDLVNFRFDQVTKTYFEDPDINDSLAVQVLAMPVNNSGQQISPRYDNQGNEIGTIVAAQPPYWTHPAPYKIYRQPTSMSDEPLQLPEGTAIDLHASGVGQDNFFYWPGLHDNSEGVLILFTPEGRVGRVAFYQTPNDSYPYDRTVAENIYLLVGRRDRIPAPDMDPNKSPHDSSLSTAEVNVATTDEQRAKLREPINWLNGDSRWIVVGAQSGRVATIENAAVELGAIAASSMTSDEKRRQQILAAREFTREMAQVGGR